VNIQRISRDVNKKTGKCTVNRNTPAVLTIPGISSILNQILPERNYPDTKKADDNEITLILFELLDFHFPFTSFKPIQMIFIL